MEGPRITAITHRDACSIAIAEGNAGGRGEPAEIIAAVAGFAPELELIAHEQANDTFGAIVWVAQRDVAKAAKALGAA